MTDFPKPSAGGDEPGPASSESGKQPAAPQDSQVPQEPDFGSIRPEVPGSPAPMPSPHPQGDPPWLMRDLFFFILFAGAATLALLMLAGIVLGMLRAAFAWNVQPRAELGRIPVLLSLQMAVEGLCFLFIYLTITQKYQHPFWQGIHWIRRRSETVPAIVIGIVLALALQWFSSLSPPNKRLPVEEWFSSAASAYAVACVGIAVAPFIEELVFRGFFYPVFERRWGIVTAVLLTSALFAVLHGSQLAWTWKEIGAIFVVGLVLTYARARSGSLVPSFLMHIAYNSTLFVSLYISSNRFRNLTG